MQATEKSNSKKLVTRSKVILVSYLIMFLAALILTIAAQLIIPNFEALFSSFGVDLPWLSRAVLDYRKFLFIIPLYMSIIVIFLIVQTRVTDDMSQVFKIVFFADLLTLIAIIATVVIAMTLPIFNIGANA